MSQRRSLLRSFGRAVTAGGTVFALLAVAGCGGADIEVERAEKPQVKALSGKAPAEGRFERAWQTKVPGGQETSTYFVDGALVIRTKKGLRGYDARTGKLSWHYREPGRSLNGIAITDGVVVLNTDREDEDGVTTDWHTVGLDAATGEVLWQKQDHWYLAYDESDVIGTSKLGVAAHGTVVVQPEEDSERLGIDARTGDERWKISEQDLSEGQCDLTEGEPAPKQEHTRVIGVRLDCVGPNSEVYAVVDAVSGDLRWSRKIPDPQSETMMRDGYTLLKDTFDSPPIVLGPTGKQLYAPSDGASCSADTCVLDVTGGRAVLTYSDENAKADNDARRVVISPGTGKARVSAAGDSLLAGRGVAADGRLYDMGALATRDSKYLLPQALRTYDVRSGAERQMPLPADSGVSTTGSASLVRVIGAAGDRVIATSERGSGGAMTLTAYQRTGAMPEPVELGGVDPLDWPKPCALLDGLPLPLLSGYDEDSEREPRELEEDPVRAGDATVPHTACRWYVPGGDLIKVNVVWVASSEKEADAMLPGNRSQVEGVDEEFIHDAFSGTRMLRIGRTVVEVEATDMDIVGKTVAKNLRTKS